MKETRKLGLSGSPPPLADGGFQWFVRESFVIRQCFTLCDSEKTEISQGERVRSSCFRWRSDHDLLPLFVWVLQGRDLHASQILQVSLVINHSNMSCLCAPVVHLLSAARREISKTADLSGDEKAFFPFYPDIAHLHIYRACSSEFNMVFFFLVDSLPFWYPVLKLNCPSFHRIFPNNDQKYLLPI